MILDVIVEDKKKRLKEHKARTSEEQMKELALVSERKSISFYEALAKPGLSIIGEFKKASPSMGKIEMTMELNSYQWIFFMLHRHDFSIFCSC